MQAYSVSIDFRHFYVDLFRSLSCGAYAYVRATHFNFKRGHTYETAKNTSGLRRYLLRVIDNNYEYQYACDIDGKIGLIKNNKMVIRSTKI